MFILVRNSDPRRLPATRVQRRCPSMTPAKCERLWCSCDLSIQISRMGFPDFSHSMSARGQISSLSRPRDGLKRADFRRPSRQSPLSRHDREENLNSQPPPHPARNGCSTFSMHSRVVSRLLEPRFTQEPHESQIYCFNPEHSRNSTWPRNSFITPGSNLHVKHACESSTAHFWARR